MFVLLAFPSFLQNLKTCIYFSNYRVSPALYHTLYLSLSLSRSRFVFYKHTWGPLVDYPMFGTVPSHPHPFPAPPAWGQTQLSTRRVKIFPPFLFFLLTSLSLFFPLTLDFFSSSSLPPTPVPQLCLGLLSLLLLGPHLIIQSLTSLHSVSHSSFCACSGIRSL